MGEIMDMFCYQCEQAAGGKGCTKVGVCGKESDIAAIQDFIIHKIKCVGTYGKVLIDNNVEIDSKINHFVASAVFSTLTNVNFDPNYLIGFLKEADRVKEKFASTLRDKGIPVPACDDIPIPETQEAIVEAAEKTNIMYDQTLDADIRALREMIIYGLKGMGAYAHHAAVYGKEDEDVAKAFYKALEATTDNSLGIGDLYNHVMAVGQANLKCMQLLETAHTDAYGHPVPTEIPVTTKKGPFIVVSGHDLDDLKMLLEQTEGKGINIYTHGEMITAHGYPGLKKYKHLIGNYGGAWQEQQKEFDGIPGAILMTTNCLQKPRDSYSDRIFTTGVVGWPDIPHIHEKDGKKDFTPVIEKALALGGFETDESEKKITVGFGHNAVLSHAETIVKLVKEGKIRRFFLIGGCDGARPGRNYFTDFAKQVPEDCIILTLACGKYRFNKEEFGDIEGIPRLLDVGQCNDAIGAVTIALALMDAFECGVNDLPLSFVLSWYEQKAVVILESLLSLGIKDIFLGPTLPAFISPNVLQVLVDNFNIMPTSTPEKDLQICFEGREERE